MALNFVALGTLLPRAGELVLCLLSMNAGSEQDANPQCPRLTLGCGQFVEAQHIRALTQGAGALEGAVLVGQLELGIVLGNG